MSSKGSMVGEHRPISFFENYKRRLCWYVGVILVLIGAIGFPFYRNVVGFFVIGTLQYLAITFPAILALILSSFLLGDGGDKRLFGFSSTAISCSIALVGVVMLGIGVVFSLPFWGENGVTMIYCGGELSLLSKESEYWSTRRASRGGR